MFLCFKFTITVHVHLYDKGIFLWCIESELPTTNMKKLQYQHVFNLTAVKQPNLHFVHFIISFQNWHVLPILLPNKLLKKKKKKVTNKKLNWGLMWLHLCLFTIQAPAIYTISWEARDSCQQLKAIQKDIIHNLEETLTSIKTSYVTWILNLL